MYSFFYAKMRMYSRSGASSGAGERRIKKLLATIFLLGWPTGASGHCFLLSIYTGPHTKNWSKINHCINFLPSFFSLLGGRKRKS
jgi:hypothetical protein